MDSGRKSLVFDRYGNIYRTILSNIYPAKNSTGFPERNLSVNFSKAYEAVSNMAGEKAFSWFEFQFGKANNFHADAVIINTAAGEMLIVESKRFSNPLQKIGEIVEDVGRIYDFMMELQDENKRGIFRINMSKISRCYGVVLADAWMETRLKTDIVNSYTDGVQDPKAAGSFLNKYCGEFAKTREFPALAYDVQSMAEIENARGYRLLSFFWQVL